VVFRSFRRHLLISSAIVATAGFTPQLALAAEFVVDTPTTVTNGDLLNDVNGLDTLTVTDTGSIDGANAAGILAPTNFNTIMNSGSIFTGGGDLSIGIVIDSNNMVTNLLIRQVSS